MQTLFAYEFCKQKPSEMLKEVLKEFAPNLKNEDFAYDLLEGILKEYKKIRKIITKHAPEWPLDKIANIDRAILEIGTYEIVFVEEVPPVVAINEAIEIAKHFGDTNSSKFINGVLSSVMNENINDKKCKNSPPSRKKSASSSKTKNS
jgi:transcription antitermination protein NusB